MSRAWLILAGTHGLTGRTVGQLTAAFGSADAICAAAESALRATGLDEASAASITRPDERPLAAALAWLDGATDHHLVSWADARYPALLRQIDDAPVALFVRGDPAALALPQLAIVGSRHASPGGAATARAFAAHLAGCGLAITSGLALGIDAAAHAGAMAGGGRTVAVMGTGPEQVYPPQHRDLAEAIARKGALCTEFPPGTAPLPAHFPRRNRLISALSVGTLVVEARARSGALITARRAAEQGREVFAIPGSIHNPLARGCHRLIRDGAKLVESAGDILEELAPLLGVPPTLAAAADDTASAAHTGHATDPDYARLLDALGWDTVDADAVSLRSGLTPAEVSSMLLILELEGSVQLLPGGRYQRQR